MPKLPNNRNRLLDSRVGELLEYGLWRFRALVESRRRIGLTILTLIVVGTAAFLIWSISQSHAVQRETRTINLFEHYGADFHLHFELRPSPSPTGTPQLDLIEINWPKQMEVNSSGYIILRVKERPYLTYVTQQSPSVSKTPQDSPTPAPSTTPSINRAGHESKFASALAVPTPLVYFWWRTEEIYGIARLTGSNFNISASTPDSQKLESGIAEWRWNISPKEAGNQVINATLEIQFVARLKDPKGVERTENPRSGGVVWLEDLPITTYKSWFTKDSLTIGSIIAAITALLGAVGLSIPWLYERLKERGQRKDSAQTKIGFK